MSGTGPRPLTRTSPAESCSRVRCPPKDSGIERDRQSALVMTLYTKRSFRLATSPLLFSLIAMLSACGGGSNGSIGLPAPPTDAGELLRQYQVEEGIARMLALMTVHQAVVLVILEGLVTTVVLGQLNYQ